MSRIIIFLLFSIAAIGCDSSEKPVEVDFSDTVEIEKKETQESVIRICVGSMITPREGYAYYKELLDYVGERLHKRVNFIEKESYEEVDILLENKKIDVAFVCGGPYVEGHKRYGLELLVAPEVDGKTFYYSYIIVHKDSKINRFEDLRGELALRVY